MHEMIDIRGGKLFSVDGEECFAVGSIDIYQSDLDKISNREGVRKILFYFVRFIGVDFSIFNENNVTNFTFLHGNFSEVELDQVCKIPSVRTIKLLDTLVSVSQLDEIKEMFPHILFK